MNLSAKKIIIAIFVLIIVFNSSGGFLKPKKAETFTWSTFFQQIAQQAVDVVHYAKEAYKWIEEKFGRTLRDVIAKRILDYIVNETVKWIQGGGEPKFIGNWSGFMKDVGDIAFDSVARETGLAKLCSPFGLQIKIGLLPVDTFGDQITCTLDKVVSNIENFYVDFSVGGWRGYNAMWEPQNNYYGVAINVADEIVKRTTEKKEAAKTEGLAGSGFMGDKQCKAGSGEDEAVVAEAMRSDGGRACSAKLDSCIEAFSNSREYMAGCREEYSMCIDDEKGGAAKSRGFAADRTGEYCDPKDLTDVTPGSMIGKAVGESITSDAKWAANIQSWVSALVNAVINAVIKKGISEMQEITSDKKDSYYPEEYKSMLAQEIEKDKQTMIKEIPKFTNEWQYLLDAKNQSLSSASSTLALLQQLQQIQLTVSSTLPLDCEPAVTAQDIQLAQDEINRLAMEIQDLQVNISAAESIITQINDADFLDEFQRTAVQTAYQDFINQYGTTAQIEAIVSGSDRQAADVEKQTKQTELTNVQNRLSVCQTAITP